MDTYSIDLLKAEIAYRAERTAKELGGDPAWAPRSVRRARSLRMPLLGRAGHWATRRLAGHVQ